MDELWVDINGYEGLYQISNKGRVKSLTYRKCVHGIDTMSKANIILKPTDNGNGYKIIFLRKNKIRKKFYVHRLVAEHFIENQNGYSIVNHIDFNKGNNAVENLEWCTQKENVSYSKERMKKPKAISKTTNTGEKYIRFSNGEYRLCMKMFHVDRTYKTLKEAIKKRNEVIAKNEKYFAR